MREPVVDILEGLGSDPAGPPLRLAAARDEPGTLQHLQMLGDRGKAHRERLGQLRHRRLARGESGQDRPPRGIGQRRERRVQVVRRHLAHNLAVP